MLERGQEGGEGRSLDYSFPLSGAEEGRKKSVAYSSRRQDHLRASRKEILSEEGRGGEGKELRREEVRMVETLPCLFVRRGKKGEQPVSFLQSLGQRKKERRQPDQSERHKAL